MRPELSDRPGWYVYASVLSREVPEEWSTGWDITPYKFWISNAHYLFLRDRDLEWAVTSGTNINAVWIIFRFRDPGDDILYKLTWGESHG